MDITQNESFKKPSIASDVVLIAAKRAEKRRQADTKLQVLLVRRANEPYRGMWALPGGFVEEGESVEHAALRELFEETGVEGGLVSIRQLYAFSEPNRDPRSWVISCAHIALADRAALEVRAGSDAQEAEWFTLSYRTQDGKAVLDLESGDVALSAEMDFSSGEEPVLEESAGLAFDHAKMIAMAMEFLRKEMELTDIALYMLPDPYTLAELQSIYEEVRGAKLQAAAFRRKVAHIISSTGRYSEAGSRYPVMLYRNAKRRPAEE
ncbi:MAG: NUDIX hydrolase [Eubacteriaceae bacterium]|jgi:ADP-ribose pyrophosphatase YjhB (NUDIX family)|nr:NUDIX hydrolase [Eubacteriaceae bacterium]